MEQASVDIVIRPSSIVSSYALNMYALLMVYLPLPTACTRYFAKYWLPYVDLHIAFLCGHLIDTRLSGHGST